MSEDKLPEEFVNYLRERIREAVQSYFRTIEDMKMFKVQFERLADKGWSLSSILNAVIIEVERLFDEEGRNLPETERKYLKEQFVNAMIARYKALKETSE